MVTPWDPDRFTRIASLIRFALWSLWVINAFILSLLSVGVIYEFSVHLWSYLKRGVFGGPW
jgi:hypothetical protein